SRIEFRYAAIHLSAPEQLRYWYRLVGVDPTWVPAGSRRLKDYNSLQHRQYRFLIRASLPGGPPSEIAYDFTVLPHFYETVWFRILVLSLAVAVGWGLYGLRLRQIRSRFALV